MWRATPMDREDRRVFWQLQLQPLLFLQLLLLLPVLGLAQNSSASQWQTLSGAAPLIIARGGSSGLFPDQTAWAYSFALTDSLPGIALFCDVQLTADSAAICRTGLDLRNSTSLVLDNNVTTREVNGVNVTAIFSIDKTSQDFLSISAAQSSLARTNAFDYLFPIITPLDVVQLLDSFTAQTGNPAYLWLNVEYALFYEQNGYNVTASAVSALNTRSVSYFSATEVALLKSLGSIARQLATKLIFKIPSLDAVEPSTNRTYSSFTVEEIANFSSGVLVPKDAIWPVDSQTLYLTSPTTIVSDYHNANLTVYTGVFANDENPYSYNYSYDPLREYINFVANGDFAPDGLLTDFPTTASEALACYASGGSSAALQIGQTPLSPSAVKRTIISNNGASGDFPGSTVMSYEAAVRDGADYIDCKVQLTKDGVAICHESPDLIPSTDVSKYIDLLSRSSTIEALQRGPGVFTFNLTWSEISQLDVKQSNPVFPVVRNPAYDGLEGIITLSTFLDLAKNHSSTGIFIDIQNAYFLATEAGLNAVDTVVAVLKQAGFDGSNSTQRVLLQSEDSSALKRLQQVLPSYERVYKIKVASQVLLAANVTVAALQQIKSFASAVTLTKTQLVEPLDPVFENFLAGPTTVVQDALQQGLTVYVSVQRNDPTVIAFDYETDPARELNTLTKYYNVSGFITDYPATLAAFLRQSCYAPVQQGGLLSSLSNYTIQSVIPGQLYDFALNVTKAPVPTPSSVPLVNVSEPPIPATPLPPNGAQVLPPPPSPVPPPAAPPSGATSLELPVLLPAIMLAIYVSLL